MAEKNLLIACPSSDCPTEELVPSIIAFAESLNSGPSYDGLTLYEKKSLIVNRHLDRMGMGRYQWCLYFLCGGGYLLDLMWAQIVALAAPSIQQELGISDDRYEAIFVAFSIGLTIGALFWGIVVDVIGRSWAFNITLLISSIFGSLIGLPNQWWLICTLCGLLGTGIGGNIPIDSTILLEFLPQNRRFLLASLSAFQPLGVILASVIAYLLIPRYSCHLTLPSCQSVAFGVECCERSFNMGWRYSIFTVGAVTVIIFFARFVVFKFIESPKFLLSKGKDQEAIDAVLAVARFNKQDCDLTIQQFKEVEGDIQIPEPVKRKEQLTTEAKFKNAIASSNISELFRSPVMIRLTLLTWVIYGFDSWGFSIAGAFLPLILRRKGLAMNLPIETTFRNTLIIYSCGVPGTLLSVALIEIPSMGRKWGMVVSSALMGISLCLFAVMDSSTAMVALNSVEYFSQSLFNAILYGWTPEAFPATIRGTACGLASTWGRLFSIASPIIAGSILANGGSNGVLFLAGGGVFVCTIAASLLPFDSKGKQSL